MKYILKLSHLEVSGCCEHRSLAVRKGRDRNLFRGRVFSNRNSWFKEPTQPASNLISVALAALCDRAESPPKEDGKVFNIRAYSCALVVQTDNTRQFPGKSNAKNLISRNEPNFSKTTPTLTHEITRNYNRSHRNHHPENEPKANPIRTQFEPNTKPIRTQYEPKTNPIYTTYFTENFSIDY